MDTCEAVHITPSITLLNTVINGNIICLFLLPSNWHSAGIAASGGQATAVASLSSSTLRKLAMSSEIASTVCTATAGWVNPSRGVHPITDF